jgi:hypothetical protein
MIIDRPIQKTWNLSANIIVILTLLALATLHIWSLMRYPPPHGDEAWFISRAWTSLHTGRVFGPLDEGVIDRFPGYWTFLPWLPNWILSLGVKLAASPALIGGRVVSLIFGVILLIAIFNIASDLKNKSVGILSVFLVATSTPFLYSAHIARYDIYAAALGYTAIALYIKNLPRQYTWLGIIQGLCVGLAFEMHPNAMIYIAALGILYIWDYRWSFLSARGFWGFSAGLLVGAGFYALLHIARFPKTYFALNHLAFSLTHTPPLFTFDASVLGRAFVETAVILFAIYLVALPVLIAALVALAKVKSPEDKRFILLTMLLAVGFIFWIRNKEMYYRIHFSPAFDIVLSVFLLQEFSREWTGRIQDYFSRASLILVAIYFAMNLNTLRNNYYLEYKTAQDQINRVVQPADVIMGPQEFWFGLSHHRYRSWEQLVYYSRYAPGNTLARAFEELHPDIFIIDSPMEGFITNQHGATAYSQHLRLSKHEVDQFLEERSNLIASFENQLYGRVRIYRIYW